MTTKRLVLKIGDVFAVTVADGTKKYFQYVANDRSMLNSSVIRAFRETYPAEEAPDLVRVVKGEVQFHAHVFLRNGTKMRYWQKEGCAPVHEAVDVVFRSTNDVLNRKRFSNDWYIWKINEPQVPRLAS